MEQKTALYDCHVKAGGNIVPFAGFLLPVQYTDILAEHKTVREKAGLFDVSHMGEAFLTGKDALANLNNLLTNSYDSLQPGRARYSPMCNEAGGVVDDLIVYKFDDEKYYIVVNASNRHKDMAWMREHLFGNAKLEDISDAVSQIALQGPASWNILRKLTAEENIPQKYYSFKDNVQVAGINCLLSQTGYTGEDGFEIYLANQDAVAMWEALLTAGEDFGLIPCGLGARDTLRLEAAMPLYGHEMDDEITPLEAELSFAVKMDKADFIGKKGIEAKGPQARTRVGLKVTGRGIVREHQGVFKDGEEIGHSTSGTFCPYLNGAYAMALVKINTVNIGDEVEVDVRGRRIAAQVVPLPFYKKPQK